MAWLAFSTVFVWALISVFVDGASVAERIADLARLHEEGTLKTEAIP